MGADGRTSSCNNSGMLGETGMTLESWIEIAVIVIVLFVALRFFMKRS
jgi:uncharacterized membrane protein